MPLPPLPLSRKVRPLRKQVVLDGISFLLLAPAALYLTHKCPGKFSQSTAKIYLGVMCLVTTLYPLYNFVIDAPMYMARYHADQAAHKR